MKIAVVSSIFIPGSGYLEEGLARVITTMGHDVCVFTSFHYPVNAKGIEKLPLPENEIVNLNRSECRYRISRLNTLIRIRSNIVCNGLKSNVIKFDPDIVILVGVSDFFPVKLLNKDFCSHYRVLAFIGQNYDMSHWRKTNSLNKRITSFIINRIIKGFLFRRSVRFLSRIAFYTPDSEEIISNILPSGLIPVLHTKKINIPLGFNSDDFYFSDESRVKIRSQLGIAADTKVITTITRVERSKRILEIIQDMFQTNDHDIVYIIVGFIDNTYKMEIESYIEVNKLSNRIICLPFSSSGNIADYFSASDFGMWMQSSASIQQAMGTGLPVILPYNKTTSLLLKEGHNGYYIKDSINKTVKKAISSFACSYEKRKEIEYYNKIKFSYQAILGSIF